MLLKDRVAIVTGGSQGIGRAISLRLSAEGAKVTIADVNEEVGLKTAEEIKAAGGEAIFVKVDVTNPEDTDRMVTETVEKLGSLHILVNNAGITRDKLILRMTDEDWDRVLDVNLKGAFNCIRSSIRVLAKGRYGRIVNIASIVGITGNPGQANYSASKGGLIALTKTVAKEFASRGITCNAVAPGFIDTAMTQAMPQKAREELIGRIPLERLGTPEDVAEGVLFLASDMASYITGEVLNINGGMFM
ncbi:MAG TPA: 3-oxoacyl-[acyl-carrier-protein] reductase [Deltaproteobacteria bacterium]|nr:3-oxoacyl-[acyl-carrier-protein] reductase [Deltaproteobacteria bacterium]